ncbi:MAG TPA: formate dehydrogenase accessory sulfurtransferase FdhD [Povalibacter sp.]|uniref:formate dehydrogenase accessory sulfurtransferase FdhD n=1 Tax=Povalibacter sp. TaxID=1962978 RepID=UPI002CC276D5|nr:formate dehydrogenase accessory sulfurtransferase FdhD [Povalibacter sp.]HMN46390.1 formate dehydrogenase accessory sulfurtransferase FdhD [Povalibacter sp.]
MRTETLVIEEPLEIRIVSQGREEVVTVTMRTPGADQELALGFLIAERILHDASQVKVIRRCGQRSNVIKVELRAGAAPQLKSVARNFVSSASCGLCGKTSLDAVSTLGSMESIECSARPIPASFLYGIPQRLRAAQQVFDVTGGLHAVAAFDLGGELLAVHEDVGRHNAVDKVIGTLASRNWRPDNTLFALSGRAGFELVQKTAAVQVPIIVAIGAPSSLAVQLAEQVGITLVGFLRAASFNVYTHPQRLEQHVVPVREAV